MYKLILAEKPAIAEAVSKALPGRAVHKNGVIEQGSYMIAWAYGHLLALKEPEDYDPAYKQWKLEDLPFNFPQWEMKPGKDTNSGKSDRMQSKADRVRQIGVLLKDASVVIHAGDIDEEGQRLIDELLIWHGYKGPVQRLDTSDLTPEALKKALSHMKDNGDFEAMGWSAYARSVADMMVGINLTRFYSLKYNSRGLVVGRVKCPTLGLVVNRDMQIESHKKTVFFELDIPVTIDNVTFKAKYQPDDNAAGLTDGRFLTAQPLKTLKNILDGAEFQSEQLPKAFVCKKKTKEEPPLPFNSQVLASYCNARWGYSPQQVMQITQELREKYKAITYNRSDCQYLTEEQFHDAHLLVPYVASNLHLSADRYDTGRKSRCFDTSKTTAHHAIIPTKQKIDISSLPAGHRNIYVIICAYYLVQFLPPAEKETTVFNLEISNEGRLSASSTVILSPGYLSLLRPSEDKKDHSLSRVPEGHHNGRLGQSVISEKETKPPKRYTKGTLLKDMTCIAKYVTDPAVKALLLRKDKDKKGENGSIGTPATRAMIIEDLVRIGYLREDGRELISTKLGRDFYDLLPDEVKKADLTAKWWALQEDISEGKTGCDVMQSQVNDMIVRIIRDHSGDSSDSRFEKPAADAVNAGKCPKCGQMLRKSSKCYWCPKHDLTVMVTQKYFDNQIRLSDTRMKTLTEGRTITAKVKGKSGKSYNAEFALKINGNFGNLERVKEQPR